MSLYPARVLVEQSILVDAEPPLQFGDLGDGGAVDCVPHPSLARVVT